MNTKRTAILRNLQITNFKKHITVKSWPISTSVTCTKKWNVCFWKALTLF